MSTRLRLSEVTSQKIDHLSVRLGLRRNIICRLAIGRSLEKKQSVRELEYGVGSGYTMNRTTITGDHDLLFKALITQHEGKSINEYEYFSKYVKNHIERGTSLLFDEYNRINSPIEFLLGLIDLDETKNYQQKLFK